MIRWPFEILSLLLAISAASAIPLFLQQRVLTADDYRHAEKCGDDPYMMRRRWDHFVRYLLGAEPPREYAFRSFTQ